MMLLMHCPQLKRLKDIYQCWKRQI